MLRINKITLTAVAILLGTASLSAQRAELSNFRPNDKNGSMVFETPKDPAGEFEKVKVRIGGNFTQQFQALDHENTAFVDTSGIVNPLYDLKPGFNLATANLNLDAQLHDGINLNLVTYLSSRHHAEAWVKGGFIQIDRLGFFNSPAIDGIMDYVTLKIGHMEINYGDAHFFRTDNGNSIYNPFVGNNIVDAFNTEIGAEVYVRHKGWMAMAGLTGGEINGNVSERQATETDDNPNRSPSVLAKIGYDRQVNDDFRIRVTGSGYYTASSAANHLFDGDRSGSRYYLVMAEPGVRAGDRGVFPSGRYNPGYSDQVTTIMGNILLKYKGLEFFGLYENGSGSSSAETESRNFTQLSGSLLYRIGKEERVYVGGRYNTVVAEDPSGPEVTINRYQLAAGWYVIDNILFKVEYVNQEYQDFLETSQFADGRFNGFMIEAAVGF
jgi:hypothetical protein